MTTRATLKGTIVGQIPEIPQERYGEDARIVEICETCPYPDCIETYSCVCKRFKEMKKKILKGGNKKQNRIMRKKKNGEII